MNEIKLIVKLVIFGIKQGELMVFAPNALLPQDLAAGKISLDLMAKKIFQKATGLEVEDKYIEQLYTFSHPEKNQEINVVYYLLVPELVVSRLGSKYWINSKSLKVNLDDCSIIDYALTRLRWKIEYTNAVYSLLPLEFTFGQLQKTYEAILGRRLDKRNFRKKISSINILKSTGKRRGAEKLKTDNRQGRPAEIFTFRAKKLTFVEIL